MSTPTASPSPSSSNTQPSTLPPTLLRNISIAALVLCPILIALPPRKLDAYTILLLAGTGAGANQVSREFTGISIGERWVGRIKELSSPLPEKALRVQAQLRREKEELAAARRTGWGKEREVVDPPVDQQEGSQSAFGGLYRKAREAFGVEDKSRVEDKVRIEDAAREAAKKGVPEVDAQDKDKKDMNVLEKVWMGDEGKDWKKKRDQREKEALEEGRGYGDLIMDQIWEVWNWGKDKAEEVKENDEKAVRERKEARDRKNGKD